MAKSTQPQTDLKTVLSTGFSAVSTANANAPAGVIQDLNGNVQGCLVGIQDVARRITEVMKDIDAADPMFATLQGIQQLLVT